MSFLAFGNHYRTKICFCHEISNVKEDEFVSFNFYNIFIYEKVGTKSVISDFLVDSIFVMASSPSGLNPGPVLFNSALTVNGKNYDPKSYTFTVPYDGVYDNRYA